MTLARFPNARAAAVAFLGQYPDATAFMLKVVPADALGPAGLDVTCILGDAPIARIRLSIADEARPDVLVTRFNHLTAFINRNRPVPAPCVRLRRELVAV